MERERKRGAKGVDEGKERGREGRVKNKKKRDDVGKPRVNELDSRDPRRG